MLFLSNTEKMLWSKWCDEVCSNSLAPEQFLYQGRDNLRPVFDFYIGSFLSTAGRTDLGADWIRHGTFIEEDGLFLNTFLTGFLERHQGRLVMPETVFADPLPYVHFTTVPIMRESRSKFLTQCGHSMPEIRRPFRMMDIGCGDGSLTAALLKHLRSSGKIGDIGELLLVDRSDSMLEMARRTVTEALPGTPVKTLGGRIEDVAARIENTYDLAVCSLSYHHMPYEQKIEHLKQLKTHMDNFILFELDANNDLPELHTPELALSVYQSYARMIDFVFAHDAPVEVAQNCVDRFLMTEAVSLLTQPRGQRNDYHMPRQQWLEMFERILAPDFQCLCDSSCYDDEYFALFTIHYGRG